MSGPAPGRPAPADRASLTTTQTTTGLMLGGLIAGGWIAVHVVTLFVLPARALLIAAPVLIALQCWLSVGLFIVAHDAMHGSLAPRRAAINQAAGRFALGLYGALWFDALLARHFAHHRAPGTDADPDFAGDGTLGPARWFAAFFAEYFSPWQVVRLGAWMTAYVVLFDVAPARIAAFWALPALLSAVQLFVFGTYLPHRRGHDDFADRHRTRSNAYPRLVSLLTCFHFGYHHEHHADPSVPWWRLPASRRVSAKAPPSSPGTLGVMPR